MRILQINASYKPAYIYGGPTMSVSALAENMARAGHDVWVYTTTANGAKELPFSTNETQIVDGVNVVYFKRLTKDHTHFSPALLSALNKNVKQFDVVHIHAWWNLVSILSCLIALLNGAKVIVSPRGTLSSYSFGHKSSLIKRIFHGLTGKNLLKKCSIHTTSISEQRDMARLIGAKQLFNIPNFISLPDYIDRPKRTTDDDTIKLLFLSRIDEKKGLDILITALAQLSISWSLSVAGDGDELYIENLKQLALSKKIDKHISWLGFVNDDKFDIYRQHDLLVLPSHNENFGNVVIESLSQGTPVLISDNVGLSDYVIENNLGWVFHLNETSLKNTIEQAFADKSKRDLIHKHAPLLIRDHFNNDILTAQYEEMYRRVVSGYNTNYTTLYSAINLITVNAPFSFIILTYNEEMHLPRLLGSIADLNAPVFILDSGSTDRTLAIANEYGAQTVYNKFANHPKQWHHALNSFPVQTPWVICIDADQSLTDGLKQKLINFNTGQYQNVNGIYFNRKFVFKGKWIKHGGYFPFYQLKMFRYGVGYSDLNENMDHRFIVPGKTEIWEDGILLEENFKENNISFWLEKHNRYSDLVAQEEVERMQAVRQQTVKPDLFGSPDERTAWRKQLWWKLPRYVRPLLYLTQRMIFKLGFLDGRIGIIFHFLQSFWFRLIVDIKIDELLKQKNNVEK